MRQVSGSVQVDHLKQPEVAKLLNDAKVVYSAGFHITACSEAILHSAELCLSAGKTYAIVRFSTICHFCSPC